MILCLETSTVLCSVALCDRSGVVALKEGSGNKSHASQLTVFIVELLSQAGIAASDLDAVAVSKGPGSYTGLRIGVSAAKGITYAASVPLIGIETTNCMFYGITDEHKQKYGADESSLFVPMLDARRMEVYYSILSSDGNVFRDISAEIIHKDTFSDIPVSVRMLFFGDGAAKCREILKRDNITFIDEYRISAAYMYRLAYKSFEEQRFEDVAYFEPFYLKDFITSRPKKNILGR